MPNESEVTGIGVDEPAIERPTAVGNRVFENDERRRIVVTLNPPTMFDGEAAIALGEPVCPTAIGRCAPKLQALEFPIVIV